MIFKQTLIVQSPASTTSSYVRFLIVENSFSGSSFLLLMVERISNYEGRLKPAPQTATA
ncbi:hypothetical protein V6Z12_A01G185800 [Gossypium hirsutum]